MANRKVIALVSGNIEGVLGPAAQGRPGTHEWTVWEGQAADKAEAVPGELLICPEFREFPVSWYDSEMRDLVILFIHPLTTVARLASPGGVRSIVGQRAATTMTN